MAHKAKRPFPWDDFLSSASSSEEEDSSPSPFLPRMAHKAKRPFPWDDFLPSASSSEEEDSGSDSSSAATIPKSPILRSRNRRPRPRPSSFSGESGSDSEGVSQVHAVTNLKPMQQLTRSTSSAVKLGTKRPGGDSDVIIEVSKKKIKTNVKNDHEENAENKVKDDAKENGEIENEKLKKANKVLFQRIWGDQDELDLLNGINKYIEVNRVDPSADIDSFFEFIQKSLKVTVVKSQLQDKMRRMKKKYLNILSKKFKPNNPHDWEAFEVMKKVWGKVEELKEEDQKGKGLASLKRVEVFTEGSGFVNGFKEMGMECLMKQGFELLDESKRAELNAKWSELHALELKHFIMKTEVMIEQAKMILEVLKLSIN